MVRLAALPPPASMIARSQKPHSSSRLALATDVRAAATKASSARSAGALTLRMRLVKMAAGSLSMRSKAQRA